MSAHSNARFARILYGADYNPEQWPSKVWDDDVALMRRARVTTATLPVFGWASLQPAPDRWEFGWLDDVLGRLHSAGIGFFLATATASVPAWLTQQHPGVLRTGRDGRRLMHGNRHTFCPSSSDYLATSAELVRRLAERYGTHPGLQLWHVGNEFGNTCWCEVCAARFRTWLQARYTNLGELNERWTTSFWGHTFTDWDQIEPPRDLGEHAMQALTLDWRRFASEALLDCCRAEIAVLRSVTPDTPVTTNLMGAFEPLDYHRWAREIDVVSWDNYPQPDDPPAAIAFRHALMRGLKDGQPFLLMEQSPSQQNWQPYNRLKPPGQLRLQSLQAIANGADAVLYFQWRRSRGGIEKLHGAVVEHHGRSDTRVFTEVAALGEDLHRLGTATLDGVVRAPVAVLFDWPTWWSLLASSGPSVDLDYPEVVQETFAALWALGIGADVLSPDADLAGYGLVIAPTLTMVTTEVAAALTTLVRAGGAVLATAFTGLVDAHDRVHDGGAPGPLRELLGLTVEEVDAVPGPRSAGIRLTGRLGSGADGHARDTTGDAPGGAPPTGIIETGVIESGLLCERLLLAGAEPVGVHTSGFYAGEPALTRNRLGEGTAWYCASVPSPEGMRRLLAALCAELGIGSPLPGGAPPPVGVEVVERVGPTGASVLYLLNHDPANTATVPLPDGGWTDLLDGSAHHREAVLPARGVRILAPRPSAG